MARSAETVRGTRVWGWREKWDTGRLAHPTPAEAPAALLDSLDREILRCRLPIRRSSLGTPISRTSRSPLRVALIP